jgi:DNA-binding response OmpR family regulator
LPGKGKILIVDDDAALVKMLNVRLLAEGFETELAVDGRTAIELARERTPDLIILDIAMPGVTGVDVIQKLQAASADQVIPVLIMTAYPHMIDLVKGYDCVRECFTKPFNLPLFMGRIQEVLAESG